MNYKAFAFFAVFAAAAVSFLAVSAPASAATDSYRYVINRDGIRADIRYRSNIGPVDLSSIVGGIGATNYLPYGYNNYGYNYGYNYNYPYSYNYPYNNYGHTGNYQCYRNGVRAY